MILDFHTHIYPAKIADKGVNYILDFYEFEHHHDGFGVLEHLNKQCAEAGVTHKVLLSVATRADQVSSINQFTSSILDEHTFAFGCMHPDFENPEQELARFGDLGLVGVKFHSDMIECDIDDKRLYPTYAYAECHNMPVYLHMGDPRYDYSHPKKLAKVLDDFPNLTVIAAHFGGYQRWEESLQYLCGRSVYFDTSSALCYANDVEIFKKIIEKHGIEWILFGSDYPITTQAEELKLLQLLQLNEAEQRAVMWENGAALLRRYGVKI